MIKFKDFLIQATTDIITILTQPKKQLILSLKVGDPTRNILLKLAEQLQRVDKLPDLVQNKIEFHKP